MDRHTDLRRRRFGGGSPRRNRRGKPDRRPQSHFLLQPAFRWQSRGGANPVRPLSPGMDSHPSARPIASAMANPDGLGPYLRRNSPGHDVHGHRPHLGHQHRPNRDHRNSPRPVVGLAALSRKVELDGRSRGLVRPRRRGHDPHSANGRVAREHGRSADAGRRGLR